MRYRIEDNLNDRIAVYTDDCDRVFLMVQRRMNLTGTLFSDFFQDGTLILKTEKKNRIFGYKLSILYQDLEKRLSLSGGPMGYQLQANEDICKIQWHDFRQSEDQFYWNEELIGASDTKDTRSLLVLLIYDMHFVSDHKRNIYALLLFLMQLDNLPE